MLDRVTSLRELLGALDLESVTAVHLNGVREVPGSGFRTFEPSGDIAFVLVGPAAKIVASLERVEEAEPDVEVVTVAFTFPIDHTDSAAALDTVAAIVGAASILDARRGAGDLTSGGVTRKSTSPEVAPADPLMEVLRFYAEPRSYINATPRQVRPVIEDGGRRARSAIERWAESVGLAETFMRRSEARVEEDEILRRLEAAWRVEQDEQGLDDDLGDVARDLARLDELRTDEGGSEPS